MRSLPTLASKILSNLNGYDEHAQVANPPPLQEGEEVFGVYFQGPCVTQDCILVTSQAVHVLESAGWRRIGFDEIEAVRSPTDKARADTVTIEMSSGTEVTIPVKGGEGRFRDVYEFSRFLARSSVLVREASQESAK